MTALDDPGRTLRRCAAAALACALAAGCFGAGDGPGPGAGDELPPPPSGYDLDALGVPRFVTTTYIDLSQLQRISLFRSSEGHDYSDAVEHCRSMKHYFKFPTAETTIYSPVTGTVRTTFQEQTAGTQVQITSAAQPAFTFVIFHVALQGALPPGTSVTAGQVLGKHAWAGTYSDIAVEVKGLGGQRRLVSYFETLTDDAFAPYAARGIASRDALVITKAQRDLYPLECNGETFTNAGLDPLPVDTTF